MSSNELFRNREEVKGIKHTNPSISPEVNHKSLISGSHTHFQGILLMHSKTGSITLNRVRYFLQIILLLESG